MNIADYAKLVEDLKKWATTENNDPLKPSYEDAQNQVYSIIQSALRNAEKKCTHKDIFRKELSCRLPFGHEGEHDVFVSAKYAPSEKSNPQCTMCNDRGLFHNAWMGWVICDCYNPEDDKPVDYIDVCARCGDKRLVTSGHGWRPCECSPYPKL